MTCGLALMPMYSLRWCLHCGRSVGTCYPHEMPCPYCDARMPSVAHNYPHVCSRGHGAGQGGVCEVEIRKAGEA